MRQRFISLVLVISLLAGLPAMSAPLFPDVRDDHWAKDAVAALAAKGLLEGYPDGTFKGDRAASRWEVAMIVARLLAKMEQAHATFATKAELEELRKLVNALREELDALGVRVTNLEENVDRLDKRVTELERITFYGYVDSRANIMSFQNTGLAAMTLIPPAIGAPLPGTPGQLIDYNAGVGSVMGAGGLLQPSSTNPTLGSATGPVGIPTWNPFSTGVLTVTNWRSGRPLVNGVGFSMKGVLGLKIKISDDWDAGAEFAAYTAQGNSVIDAYYGVTAPYLSNVFTGTTTVNGGQAGVQSLNNQPFTRMTLDHFWVKHNPSATKLVLGAFHDLGFSRGVYVGMLNPNEWGPEYLDNFGIQVKGEYSIDEDDDFKMYWEVMGTKLPDGNLGALPNTNGFGQSYFSHAEGGDVKFTFHEDRGSVKLNFLHAANDASNGSARTVGLIQTPNLATLNWVNPNGYFVGQGATPLNGFSTVAGIGSTSDGRPVPTTVLPGALNPLGGVFGIGGATGATFVPDGQVGQVGLLPGLLPPGTSAPNFGGIGPQDQVTIGGEAGYTFDNEYEPNVYAQYYHSSYRPQKNSGYSADGNAFKVGAGAVFFDKNLSLDIHYLQVDPRFSPFIIQTPNIAGLAQTLWHTPDFNYFNNLTPLHDTKELPHNRQGFRIKSTWKFQPTGRITVEYGNLQQTQTSLQDIRYSPSSIAAGIPNTPVLGYSPGFIEPVFGAFSPFTFASNGSNALAIPLENPRGKVENLYLSAGHKWLLDEENSNRGVLLSGGFKYVDFYRNSNMSAILPTAFTVPGTSQVIRPGVRAENQNLVDLAFIGWHVGVDYDVTEDFTAKVGFTAVDIFGHLDPLGVNNAYAESVNFTRFNNVDITQTWPELGFNWNINDDISWNMEARYYTFKDNVPNRVFNNPQVPSLNVNSGLTSSAAYSSHPFNWRGLQVSTQFQVKF